MVLLYAMNDGDYLYLAIDNPNDATGDTYDQMGIYFDDNPLPSDGLWTNTGCGNPDGEGNFWVLTSTVKYREWISGPVTCDLVIPAPGTNGAISYGSGHAQAEIAIDLDSSALRATPGGVINMYLWIYDADTATFDGYWPIAADYQDPSTYRPLTLAGAGPLVYYNHAVDDDNNDQSSGDGDGVVECGESIELYVTLRNLGSGTATGVNTAISTGDPYVTWLYNTGSDYPDITGGGTGSNNNDFDFAVAPNTPDGHVVQFNLDVNAANGGPWPDSFSLAVACSRPDLTPSQWPGWEYPIVPSSITGTSVVNTLYANYVTYVDWGISNSGDADCGGDAYGNLYLDDDLLASYNFGDVQAGQTWALFDWGIIVDTPGRHTLKFVADEGDLISESDENNNVFERDFYWTPVAPYTDDMESGVNDWTADGLWHQVVYTSPYPASHSGSHSWWYGQDITGTYGTGAANSGDLTSPPVYIPDSGYYLRFWYWYETETQGPDFDTRVVQISVDDGPFYDVLQLYDDPMNRWLQSQAIDLSSYAGHTIQVRFHFDTLDEYFNDYRGWYIDDFEISATPPPACADGHEPNDTPAQATAITYGQTLSADICPGGDYDFYTFTGTAGDKVVIDIDAESIGSLLDSYIFLLEGDGAGVLAESDDEILAEIHDSHLGYRLPYTGTYYIKVKAWDHPSAGSADHFYTIRLLTDDSSPSAEITSPDHYAWLDPILQTITTDVSDGESGIRNVVFYWHDADWDNSDWIVLEDDRDPRDGWTYDFDTSVISEQLQSCVLFIYAYDWVGNYAGYGSYSLGLDRTPPTTATVSISPMYGDAPFRDFWVDWWGSYDDLSGIADYDVQYRDGAGGVWTNLAISTTRVYTRFVGLDDHTYYFRARARDYAGNEGGYSDEAQYTVDICDISPDGYEADDEVGSAQWVTTDGISQTHNIHVEGDQDWMRFYAAAGVTYTLATTNTGGHADTILYLYDTDGTTLIDFNDDYPGMWFSSRIDWQPTVSGVYYVQIDHWDPWAYGCTTEYGLSVVADDEISPTGSVVINDGDTYAPSNVVTLTLAADDIGTGVNQVMIANDSSFGGAAWTTYTASLIWTLTAGEGVKTVYVRFRDRAGNVSELYNDTIEVYEPASADFIANPTNGSAPLTVHFTDMSGGSVVAWEWDFGDGETSALQHPTHVYTAPGAYTVSLTVRLGGDWATLPGGMDTLIRGGYITVKHEVYLPLILRNCSGTSGHLSR